MTHSSNIATADGIWRHNVFGRRTRRSPNPRQGPCRPHSRHPLAAKPSRCAAIVVRTDGRPWAVTSGQLGYVSVGGTTGPRRSGYSFRSRGVLHP